MLHLLPCLITFNIVEYIKKSELNNCCGVSSICNSLHFELHLICSIVCCTLPCHASLNRTCIILDVHHAMFMWWLFTMFLASFRVASLVSFGFIPKLWGFDRLRWFVYFLDSLFFLVGSHARWPYPRNLFYLCLLVARSIAMPRYLPLALSCLPDCHVKPQTLIS